MVTITVNVSIVEYLQLQASTLQSWELSLWWLTRSWEGDDFSPQFHER